ncbi:MAG: tRNA 4-thiouridine(8) synthase ThiI [Candidatus Altiarchaeales archaeon HGW-Altiarchaeales-3]|nr:MAG: tRNA 4-thiouridine(8) synthase ThiI [Candidatus Altiarchaeales archaeon HGW-Altiarchaeales-3]
MNYNIVIVRYGEIFLKSDYVRVKFQNKLIENLSLKLKKKNIPAKVIKKRHRIYIESDCPGAVADAVKDVFGVVSVSPAIKTGADMNEMTDAAVTLAEKLIKPGDSFAVDAHRTGKHDFSSTDVEVEIGGKIQSATYAKVDLTNPDKTIFIEIQETSAFIFDKKIGGFSGMPYGTQGKVIVLISGGIDSPVAAFMMARRGCEIIALHFGSPVDKILKQLENYSVHKIKTYNIPGEDFNEILDAISKVAGKYTCVVCKIMMMKFAEKLLKIENAKGIVMGDSLGQVASQTLDNLMVVNSAVLCPVYRPLIGMDKEDIIKIARKIGTFELQETGTCAYVPEKPSTAADLKKIEEIEKDIGIDELIKSYLEKC